MNKVISLKQRISRFKKAMCENRQSKRNRTAGGNQRGTEQQDMGLYQYPVDYAVQDLKANPNIIIPDFSRE